MTLQQRKPTSSNLRTAWTSFLWYRFILVAKLDLILDHKLEHIHTTNLGLGQVLKSFSFDQLFKQFFVVNFKYDHRTFFFFLFLCAQIFQGWCSTNAIPLTIPKSFLPEVQEEKTAEVQSQPIKPEIEEPAVSSWCSKAKTFFIQF